MSAPVKNNTEWRTESVVSWFLCRTQDDFADEAVWFLSDDHPHRRRPVIRPEHPLSRFAMRFTRREARVGRTRADHRHANAVLPHLFRKGLGEPDDSELGRAIDRAICRTDFSSDGGNIDDVPAFALDHGWKYESAGKKDPAKIRIHERFKILVLETGDRPEDSKPGRVHQNVHRPAEKALQFILLATV